ncbi:MAG: hypothetical protein M1829_002619 [Trizodia sp. TS-e1964]|nr:MAG: hypothetical protein M1829_002619 [Trizodia sp. TS-e1964]
MPPSDSNLLTLRSDVEILHLIVAHAQTLPDSRRKPITALYNAYQTILAEKGINADNDSVFIGFILKLSVVPGNGTLYDKFEFLLEQMGIELEFDEDQSLHEAEVTREIELPHTSTSEAPVSEYGESRGRTPRRASFSSVYDVTNQLSKARGWRSGSHSPSSRLPARTPAYNKGSNIPSESPARTPKRSHSEDRSIQTQAHQTRNRKSYSRVRHDAPQNGQRRDRSISRPKSRSLSKRGPWLNQNPVIILEDPLVVETSPQPQMFLAQRASSLIRNPGRQISPNPVLKPSEAQFSTEADRLKEEELSSHALSLGELEVLASKYDRIILLSQAFDTWRAQMRQAAETRRFFAQMERRAQRARNLYLLTKAFTHWAQSASDEIQRTSVARRHILRTKYFNAWRDITAVNELKVRRQGLRKGFKMLKDRYNGIINDSAKALTHYQENLVFNVYWKWFWRFCDNRAPGWWGRRKKRKYLSLLVNIYRERSQREHLVEDIRQHNSRVRIMNHWCQRTRTTAYMAQQAEVFRDRVTCSNIMRHWHFTMRLRAPNIHVSNMVDWRVARQTFSTWIAHTRAVRTAREFDRLRLLHNAWAIWNERLRILTLANRIDERVVLQALYRWVLAERLKLLRRFFDRRLKRKMIRKVILYKKHSKDMQLDTEQRAHQFRTRQILKTSVRRWRLQIQLANQREQLAMELYAPKALKISLCKWLLEFEHIQKLNHWANEANFYFLTKKTLHHWQSATEISKREKRRVAYAQVKRMVKINLARTFLKKWYDRTKVVVENNKISHQVYSTRLIVVGMNKLDMWRGRTEEIAGKLKRARARYDFNLQQKGLHSLAYVMQEHGDWNERAKEQIAMHVQSVALAQLRKLGMRILHHQQLESSAERYKLKNERKHLRNMVRIGLRYLHDKYRVHQGPNGRENDDEDGHFEDVENMTSFNQDFTLNFRTFGPRDQMGTPSPALFATPSKRAIRLRSAANLSTATPSTPLGTPYSRHWLGSARKSGRKLEFAKSRRTFEAIEETSPQPLDDQGNIPSPERKNSRAAGGPSKS